MSRRSRLSRLAWCLFWAVVVGLQLAARPGGPAASPGETPAVWVLEAVTLLLWGGLVLLALFRGPADERVTVFAVLGAFVGSTIVFEALVHATGWNQATERWAQELFRLAYSAVYLFNFVLIVHLTALIPRRHPVVARRPAVLWSHYLLGAAAVTAGYLLLRPRPPAFLTGLLGAPDAARVLLNTSTYLWAGILGLVFLGSAARREATVAGRRQALIVFSGLLVWTLNVALYTFFTRLLSTYPLLALVEPLANFLVPVCLFVAILGFRLFEVELFVRKGLIYGVTVALLAAGLFGAWVAAGFLLGHALRLAPTPWNTALLLLAVGILFEPLRRGAARGVDRLFFREKLELERLQRSILPELADRSAVDGAAEHLARRLAEALQLDAVSVLLADEERRFFRERSLWRTGAGAAARREVVLTQEEVRASDLDPGPRRLAKAPGRAASELRRLGGRVTVPLTSRDRLVGLVVLGAPRAGADLDRRDLDLLEAIAHQAAAVLDNLRLLDLATTDPLTRLPRRQVFEERLRQELERSARTGRPLAVALADVDDFKRLNDGHGHLAGDRALQAVAATLAGGCRSTDLVARFGGEEFVLLFPETGLEAAGALAEKLRAGVAAREVTGLDGERLSVTVSVGLAAAEGPGGGVGPADLLRAADEALYRAKAGGKNRVEAAGGRAA